MVAKSSVMCIPRFFTRLPWNGGGRALTSACAAAPWENQHLCIRGLTMSRLALPAAALLTLTATAAEAHTRIGAAGGFGHGFAHPLGGTDHVLAMVAVGLF